MKTTIMLLAVFLGMLLLLSCGDGSEDTRAAYMRGVSRGAKSAVMRLEVEAKAMRLRTREQLAKQLLPLSVVLVTVTLFGAKAADSARRRVSDILKLSKDTQILLAKAGYAVIALGTFAVSYWLCGFKMTLPVAVLLAGSAMPFAEYIEALRQTDKPTSWAALTKIKTLFFYILTIILLSQILSDIGFMALKLSR